METTEITYKDYVGVYRDYRVYFWGYIGKENGDYYNRIFLGL